MAQRIREDRIEFAIEELERHIRESTVVKNCAIRFKVSQRQAREYVRRAWLLIRERRGATKEFDVHRMEQTFEELLLVALEKAEEEPRVLGAAVQAADRLAKIRGVYQPDRVKHEGGVVLEMPFGFKNAEEARARIATLLGKKKTAEKKAAGGTGR